jgi:hypothetical protein
MTIPTRVTKVADQKVKIEGSYDDVFATLTRMQNDGVLERVVRKDADRTSDYAVALAELRTLAPAAAPAPESPSPSTPKQSRKPALSEGTWRVLALSALILALSGSAILASWAVVLGAQWLWALILSHISGIVTITLLVGLATWALRSKLPSLPKGKSSVPSSTSGKCTAFPVTVLDNKVIAGERDADLITTTEHHWLTGRVKSAVVNDGNTRTLVKVSPYSGRVKSQVVEDASVADDLTTRWIAKMRDKRTGQSIGRWRGGSYDLMADSMYAGSLETAINMHSDDRCAVGHLLDLDQPYDGAWGRNAKKHPSMAKVRNKYGRLIDDVIRMNDRGKSLKKIADHVERKTSRRGR